LLPGLNTMKMDAAIGTTLVGVRKIIAAQIPSELEMLRSFRSKHFQV
jgi:hypothetical protein